MAATIEGDNALLTINQVRERLNVSLSTFQRLVRLKKFPQPIKLGRLCRWKPEEVSEWIDKQHQEMKKVWKAATSQTQAIVSDSRYRVRQSK